MSNGADEVRDAAQELREAAEAVDAPVTPSEDNDDSLNLSKEIRRLRSAITQATDALGSYRKRVRFIGGALAVALAIVVIVGGISVYSLLTRQDDLQRLVDQRGAQREAQIQALATKVNLDEERTHDALCTALESPSFRSQPDPTLGQLHDNLGCTPELGDRK